MTSLGTFLHQYWVQKDGGPWMLPGSWGLTSGMVPSALSTHGPSSSERTSEPLSWAQFFRRVASHPSGAVVDWKPCQAGLPCEAVFQALPTAERACLRQDAIERVGLLQPFETKIPPSPTGESLSLSKARWLLKTWGHSYYWSFGGWRQGRMVFRLQRRNEVEWLSEAHAAQA